MCTPGFVAYIPWQGESCHQKKIRLSLLMSQSFPILLNIEIQYNDEFAFKLITTTANNLHLQKCITSKASKLPKRSTVDENLKKSHSTLRAKRAMLKFSVNKSLLKMPKIVNFWKTETCGQTVLPDRPVLIWHLVENATISYLLNGKTYNKLMSFVTVTLVKRVTLLSKNAF